jgi:WS/DGAT/MGAT family acyltransferase
LLDRSKPLWECHIIDKIEGSSFAVYTKIHHAYADGITMSRWILQSLNSTPESKRLGALWQDDGQEQTQEKAAREALFKRLLSTGDHWRKVLGGSAKLLTQLALEQAGLTKNAVALPFKASEDTPLNGPMSAERQFASARISMDRIIELRASTRCTLNHIALTCIDGALRRYLHDQDIELERPLSVQMPVSLRDKNDKPGGNKVGIVLVDLAPKDSDAYTRLREIGFTLRNVRNQIDGVPAAAVTQYTIVMAAALELAQLLKLGNLLPAVADTLVSNVPGPAEPLYLKGARLEQMLPISALLAGGQLNITLYSYSGTLFFGLVATERVVQLKHLARYIQEAFDELETAVYGP